MKYTHSCILLHSFTSSPNEMIYFSKHITNILPKNMRMKYIYPKAPIIKISCYEGIKYPSWYDYLTNYKIYEEEISIKDLHESCNRIHNIINEEKLYHKDNTSKIFIGGYSQGACMALASGILYPDKLAGIIGFKGHIPSDIDEHVINPQRIWVCHGLEDKTIGYKVAKTSYDKYKKRKYDITFLSQKKVNHEQKTGIKELMDSLKLWLDKY